ncbi:g3507 [Coccomyxa viridis]|uniref:G3507 protein n=1 Tax=Coccomyxa viridis TaxID=1274662 RepID=A0ABP1FTC0_9CHLO
MAALLTAGGPCSPAEARARLTQDEQLTIDVFKKNTPSVVYIENLALRRDQFTLDLMEKVPQGAGSGTIWDTDGHVVTNAHVIAGASDLQVSLMGDEEYPASVVGVDRDKDVAVLQLKMPEDIDKKKRLHPVTLGTSADLQVGQRVYAIGNPYGLDHTLTTGVISGTGREINSGNTGRPIENVIQTDAAINPGNSGGPLLDTGGDLIGINTAIYSPSGANSGVGFAVPVDIIRSSVNQIIQFGKVLRPILGISFAPDQSVEQLQQGIQGILVLDARDGSPARLAGVHGTRRDQSGRLVLGDIISAFNGKKVKTGTDLYRELDRCTIGDDVDLEILRGSEKVHLKVTLGSSS